MNFSTSERKRKKAEKKRIFVCLFRKASSRLAENYDADITIITPLGILLKFAFWVIRISKCISSFGNKHRISQMYKCRCGKTHCVEVVRLVLVCTKIHGRTYQTDFQALRTSTNPHTHTGWISVHGHWVIYLSHLFSLWNFLSVFPFSILCGVQQRTVMLYAAKSALQIPV